MTMIILKILAVWLVISFITAWLLTWRTRRDRRELANHLSPLPEGSILGNHPERELSR